MYAPYDRLQDTLMAALLDIKVGFADKPGCLVLIVFIFQGIDTLWINIKRVPGTDDFVAGGSLVDEFSANWAPNEPSSTGDCVLMDKNLGY